ncbi:MAG: hypothetical protein KDA24_22420 [Deltaproteobacteria bacterium]|nr:hypothetical protein [Deltaproteobacteria bacterium]
MRTQLSAALVLFALLLAVPASAEKGPPKLKQLTPMLVDLGEAPSDEALKAIKVADRCAKADRTWMRAMEPEQQVGIDELHELLAAPVTCWQGAAKKGAKAGDSYAPILKYVEAQALYVQTLRAYIFALQAKYIGDRLNSCKRFKLAIKEAAAATSSTEGVVDGFTNVEAKTLAAQQSQNIVGMGATIADEFSTQKCD